MAKKTVENPTNDPNVMPDITGPGGQTTRYKPEYDQMLIEHMTKGYSFESFGAITEVSVGCMNEWVKQFASFHASKVIAFNKCRIFWETLGIYYAVEGRRVQIDGPEKTKVINGKKVKVQTKVWTKGTEKLNANIYRLNMVNRFNWKNSGSEEADGTHVTVNLHAQIMDSIKAKREKGGNK